jgi:lipoprotein-anchoring transpeptidase ErfK/SrfK
MKINRRDFLKLSGLGLTSAWLGPRGRMARRVRPDEWSQSFAPGAHLGRVTIARTALHVRPTPDSPQLGWKYLDEVSQVLREVVGKGTQYQNHVWMETPEGFLYAPDVQPIVYQPNVPLEVIAGGRIWVEVSVPFADSRAKPRAEAALRERLYYASIYPVSEILHDESGAAWYHLDEEKYTGLYVPAEALRPIAPDELSPITPEVEDKKIIVDLGRQSLSAFENEVEVFHARIASGAKLESDGGKWTTPPGAYRVQRKWIGVRMAAGDAVSGYDLPGVGWPTIFISSNGVAIHSTYWHNDYGIPKSHGCVNARPQDAKWVFRWTRPYVSYLPGEAVPELPGGTPVVVRE